MGFIYKITNQINSKVYIGLTTNTVEKRWQEHKNAINQHKDKRPLYNAMFKYGINNFSIETIEECDDLILAEREIYWIDYYNSYYDGYNATFGGEGRWNRKIQQFDLTGKFIKTFNNIVEASQELKVSESVIRSVCQHIQKTISYKYLLKYEDDSILITDLIEQSKFNFHHREVYQYGLDGTLVKIWNSIKEIQQEAKIEISNKKINDSKPHSGYVWRDPNKDFLDGLDLKSIIVQIHDDKIIGYYDSFLSAAKSLGKNTGSAISECCRNIGYHKSAYGYEWRYLKDVLGQFSL